MPTERRLAARLQRGALTRRMIAAAGRRRAAAIVHQIRPLLDGDRYVLDIGAGTCNVAELLGDLGLRVTPLDVANLSFVDEIEPVVYDGRRIPFRDRTFDVALLGAVLHHISDQERLVREAARVARVVIVVEDEHGGELHRSLASFVDSLLSLELDLPSHRYRDESAWRELFDSTGLEVREIRRWQSVAGLFRNVAFRLEPADGREAATLRSAAEE